MRVFWITYLTKIHLLVQVCKAIPSNAPFFGEPQLPYLIIRQLLSELIQYQSIRKQMDLEGLVVKKGLKGKQNKKKWVKNIDVSGLLEKVQQQEKEELLKKFTKPLIVEDTTNKARDDLDPNRFKNRIKSQPKQIYDNSYKRDNLIQDGMEDAWDGAPPAKVLKKPEQIVPAIIKPLSGHSYNPKKQDIEQIIDEVIDFEKPRPRKKIIKKAKQTPIIKRVRNKKLRQQFLEARQRKKERQALAQIHSMKRIKKQIQEKERKTLQKIEEKKKEQQRRLAENKTGKVRQGPKIGKKRYNYRQYIPSEQEIGKKISKVSQSDQLMKQQYDSIFRRGIIEPRSVKVHANKTKNIKVTQRFEQD